MSKHIEHNAESLRSHFVDFDGKKVLTVIRNYFVFGSQDNDWAGVFEEFADKIR